MNVSFLIHFLNRSRRMPVALAGRRDGVEMANQSPRFEITLETSSMASSSRTRLARWEDIPRTGGLADIGGLYTLGKDGAVAEVGLDPPSPVEFVGDSGGRRDDDSVMRDRDEVKSSDCARFCSDRGFETCSFILVSKRESEPRLSASSVFFVREGIPEPLGGCQPIETTKGK
jgi:hypothetical protein